VGQVERWEREATRWAQLVRAGGNGSDSILETFASLLPPAGRATLDLACGEGRLSRWLAAEGHHVVGIDSSPTMIRLASEADPDGDYRVADAAELPLDIGSVDLVVAYMCLQDLDDPAAALLEAARVLMPDGRLCLAIIHPFWSAGEVDEEGDRFLVRGSYFDTIAHIRPVLQVPSVHRPLEAYFRALEVAGLMVETLRELPTTGGLAGRLPTVLLLRAIKPRLASPR
jgi:SAM-dependent methyltransferase